ncbi:MAG: hypothetical protein B7733_10765 [Myxococcales bacterium FL481]|nr:MAG: hypothetical protein B7733_10765 [Myxococcales bacterium FL481]
MSSSCNSRIAGLVGCLLVGGCYADADPRPDSAAVGEPRAAPTVRGKEVEIELPPGMSDDRAHEVVAYLESRVGVEQIRVRQTREASGPVTLSTELWGPDAGVELAPGLRAAFPELASAAIRELELASSGAPSHPLDRGDLEQADPQVVQRRIVEQLRADGIDGEVKVDVSEDGDGRRVEVRVEHHERPPQP